jgi:serine protease Do
MSGWLRFVLALILLVPGPIAARDPLPSFADVLARAEPAVVNIATVAKASEEDGEPETMQDLLRRYFGEAPRARRSLGSGFIISAEGDIVTNNHVVQGAERIRVRVASGEELDARVVGADETTDIALVHVKAPAALPTLAFGDSDALQVGDWVLAIGNPFGLSQTATAGIVSAKGRFLGAGPYDDFIQTDASINPGNSGGPLIDQQGRVIGINAAIVAPAGGNVGIGFAVPANLARWVIDQLRAHGTVVRGWIGVAIQPVTPELARSFGLEKPTGGLVADVTAGSPAAKAGIQRGDVIVTWGDHEVKESRELPTAVAGTSPGTQVPVGIVRNGRRQTLQVTVGKMPASAKQSERTEPEDKGFAAWGLSVRALPASEARRLGIKAGALVEDVAEGSPADDAGIEPGDVIIEANRRPVGSPADLRHALAANRDHALLRLRRGSASLFVELTR